MRARTIRHRLGLQEIYVGETCGERRTDYVRTYARIDVYSHVRTYIRTDVRTYVGLCPPTWLIT